MSSEKMEQVTEDIEGLEVSADLSEEDNRKILEGIKGTSLGAALQRTREEAYALHSKLLVARKLEDDFSDGTPWAVLMKVTEDFIMSLDYPSTIYRLAEPPVHWHVIFVEQREHRGDDTIGLRVEWATEVNPEKGRHVTTYVMSNDGAPAFYREEQVWKEDKGWVIVPDTQEELKLVPAQPAHDSEAETGQKPGTLLKTLKLSDMFTDLRDSAGSKGDES